MPGRKGDGTPDSRRARSRARNGATRKRDRAHDEGSHGLNGGPPPRVSVIITAYRVSDYIADTLTSVFSQTYDNFEVIVVNDGCPDTPRLEAAIAPFRDRLRYIVQRNGGPSKARNTGIQAARGELIAQLDGDDQWFPGFLASQVRFLDEHPDTDIVFTDAVVLGGPNDGRGFFAVNGTEGEASLARLLNLRVVFLSSSMTARRKCLQRVGMYDRSLRLAEDFDLWLRLAAAGCQFDYYRDILVRYRRNPDSLSGNEVRMLNAGLEVLSRFERNYALQPVELDALREGRIRLQSQLSFRNAVDALRRGDAWRASRELAGVRTTAAPVRLWVLRAALRVAPRLTVDTYRRMKGINRSA